MQTLELILVYILLLPFILINIAIIIGSFLEGKVAGFARKILKLEEEFEQARAKTFGIIYTIIWLVAGVAGVLMLDNPLSLGGIMVFLAFRGGANLSTRVLFGIHDTKLIKLKTEDSKIIGLVSIAFQIGIAVEVLFLLMWGLLYKFLYLTVRTAFGVDVNIIMITLWGTGLIFGFIFAAIRSRGAQGFLLKDEIGIILLLSGKWLEEKIKEKTKFLPW